MQSFPSLSDIQQAADRISPHAHKTPVITSKTLNAISGADVYFKCENFQKVGAFKFRGAANAVFSLSDEEKSNGVVTHSSGNHAQALALSAKICGIKAYIVMPETASTVKKAAVRGYGAEIIECTSSLESRESTVAEVKNRTGATLIHPYNDNRIIAGQATASKELVEEVNDLDYIFAPVGGGGLLSGTALLTHYILPKAKVIAGEPMAADDAFRSLQAGEIMPSINPKTIADGLLTSLGDKTFPIIKEFVDEIITVSEEEIIASMKLVWERVKIIIEPSAAVPVGALFKEKEKFKNKKVGIILSGGNVDLQNLPF
jgi:threonine dehydratase